MQIVSALVGSAALFVVACSRPLGPGPISLAGTFDLAEINGQPLPIKGPPMPEGRAGVSATCHQLLDEGRLSLDPDRGRYDLHYLSHSSCDGRIFGNAGDAVGSYTRAGSNLVFEIPSIDRPRQFRGAVTARAIIVQFYDQRMVFRLPGSASALPVRGLFSRRATPGRPTAAESAGSVGGGCSLTVDAVALEFTPDPSARTILAPATGRFSRRSALRNPCTGHVTHRSGEGGSYEQIARVIYFEVYPAPRIFHKFRGVIVSDDEIEVITAGGFPQRFAR